MPPSLAPDIKYCKNLAPHLVSSALYITLSFFSPLFVLHFFSSHLSVIAKSGMLQQEIFLLAAAEKQDETHTFISLMTRTVIGWFVVLLPDGMPIEGLGLFDDRNMNVKT